MTDQITIPGRHWIARYYPKLLQLSFSVFKWALISLPVMFLLVSLLDGRICQDSSCLALLALFVPTLSALVITAPFVWNYFAWLLVKTGNVVLCAVATFMLVFPPIFIILFDYGFKNRVEPSLVLSLMPWFVPVALTLSYAWWRDDDGIESETEKHHYFLMNNTKEGKEIHLSTMV